MSPSKVSKSMDKRMETVIKRLGLVLMVTIATAWASAGCSSVAPQDQHLPASFSPTSKEAIVPLDSPTLPPRGFFMGLLPVPGEGQSFAEAYRNASSCADFTPVWGRPTAFYNLAQELSGTWGKTFVEQYARGNGMFPLVHMSFIGANMTLTVPPGMSGATLENKEWRKSYKQAAIDIVRTARPLYFSIGNEVNRWYEQYGADDGNPNGFQHYVSLYGEIYDAVKQLSPQTLVFRTASREIVAE